MFIFNKRKRFFLLLTFAALALFFYFFLKPRPERQPHPLQDKQSLIVEAAPGFDISLLRIYYHTELDSSQNGLLVFDGKPVITYVPFAWGNASFTIWYKDSLLQPAGHFVTDEFGANEYKFSFFLEDKKPSYHFSVSGSDSSTTHRWNEMYHWSKSPWFASSSKLSFDDFVPDSAFHNIININLSDTDSISFSEVFKNHEARSLTGTFNDQKISIRKLETRGKSSIEYPRKSFNVTLQEPVIYEDTGLSRELKSFALVSLNLDRYYYHNIIGNELIREYGIGSVFYAPSEVKINGDSNGLYLITEKPKKHVKDSLDSEFLYSRSYLNSSFNKRTDYQKFKDRIKDLIGYASFKYAEYDASKKLGEDKIDEYLHQYSDIYRAAHRKSGEELYNALNELMDLESYFRVMAFSYIVCNKDFTDEVIFYIGKNSPDKRFRVFIKDLDDILSNRPHEGWAERDSIAGSKLIFSTEDDLDRAIASDPFLYDKYLRILKETVNKVDDSSLERIFKHTYRLLYPYYISNEVISQSERDAFGIVYTEDELQRQLKAKHYFLQGRIRSIKDALK